MQLLNKKGLGVLLLRTGWSVLSLYLYCCISWTARCPYRHGQGYYTAYSMGGSLQGAFFSVGECVGVTRRVSDPPFFPFLAVFLSF